MCNWIRPHRWFLRDMTHMVSLTMGTQSAITELLYACERCNEYKTESIDGHWPRESFFGSAGELAEELIQSVED